jgi:hypothetical protein
MNINSLKMGERNSFLLSAHRNCMRSSYCVNVSHSFRTLSTNILFLYIYIDDENESQRFPMTGTQTQFSGSKSGNKQDDNYQIRVLYNSDLDIHINGWTE